MPDYRFYNLKSNSNDIVGPPKILQFAGDQEAIAEAKKLLDGLDIEIWDGARVVIRLKPSDK